MREELQAATEELGGGTVEHLGKSALKDYARKLAVAEEEAYAVDAAHAVSMRLLATKHGAAEHSTIAEDVVESVREDAACVVEEAAARVEAAEEEAAALAALLDERRRHEQRRRKRWPRRRRHH